MDPGNNAPSTYDGNDLGSAASNAGRAALNTVGAGADENSLAGAPFAPGNEEASSTDAYNPTADRTAYETVPGYAVPSTDMISPLYIRSF